MCFGPIALSFAPFPFYPLHAPQAGPQKTSQICVLLLQVASLDDFNDVSDTILMTSWCIRPHSGDILLYPTWFWQHVSFLGDMFSWVLWKCPPRRNRKQNYEDRHEAFLMKNLLFFDVGPLGLLNFSFSWRAPAALDPSRSNGKTDEKLTFSLFGPIKPPHIPITLAI